MYLWGRDVLSPWGNLLVARGARTFRREDRRHDVRCYEFGTDDGTVLLHSTGVEYHFRVEDGRLEAAGAGGAAGLAYLRPHHRAFVLPAGGSVLPCRSTAEPLPAGARSLSPRNPAPALTALLSWIRDYERWAATRVEAGWRLDTWARLQRVPKGVRWLRPSASAAWLDAALAAWRN